MQPKSPQEIINSINHIETISFLGAYFLFGLHAALLCLTGYLFYKYNTKLTENIFLITSFTYYFGIFNILFGLLMYEYITNKDYFYSTASNGIDMINAKADVKNLVIGYIDKSPLVGSKLKTAYAYAVQSYSHIIASESYAKMQAALTKLNRKMIDRLFEFSAVNNLMNAYDDITKQTYDNVVDAVEKQFGTSIESLNINKLNKDVEEIKEIIGE